MSGVVTGDAVVLGLQPARLPSRALALLLDLVVVWAAYLLIGVGLTVATASLDEAAQMAVSIACFLLVLVGAPIAVETLSHGRSLGKLACGLRVVRDDGGPIRFRHALVRGAMGVVEILMTFGVVACIASLVSARGRRIGDVFAGTLVVRERLPAGRTAAVPPPPPWLVGRFTELDLSAVPESLWLEIRQYLTRMRQLDPAVGQRLAERPPVRQGLHRDRRPHQDQQEAGDGDGHLRGLVQRGRRDREPDADQQVGGQDQTLRECLPVIGCTHHESGTTSRNRTGRSQRPRCVFCLPATRASRTSKEPRPSEDGRGIN
ncbi:RDD family protein [Streptomyces sp. MS191]|uniref:RDD family protein n=1 Tax=Streptomyces sp. ms191 TaxID=1827978 RepID=UPI0021C82D37|nr:RDD family protein [Streptomyces sp. ms191]